MQERPTNKAIVAAVVFSIIETATFEQAEQIGRVVCNKLGIDPHSVWEGAREGAA